MTTFSNTDVVTGSNPFVGPRPLETGQMIFGRDREIEHLYFLLSAERIVLLHSPSGAGKSSLVQAGLIPRLTPLFDVWGPTRVNLQPPESDSASVNRYVRSANLGFEARIPKDRQRLPEVISPHTLSEYVAKRPRRRSAPKNIVLIFDQFEEILTVDPLALDAKREFFDQVGELLQDPHVWSLFALREDFLAPLDPYAEQVPTHLKNRFRLDLLGRDAAREAISKSIEEGGRNIANEAVEKLVNDLATMQVQQPDGTFESKTGPHVEPLHLQVACRGLWERMPEDKRTIDQADIESFGDVTKALADYYEREVAGIAGGHTRVERAIREWVGGKLITPDGIRCQVLRGVGESEGLDNELIGRLVDTHLVRGEQRAGALWYELSHDRLIEPIRESNAAWLESHLSMLQRDAAVWKNKGRPSALLMQGRPLKNAERWAADHASELTQVEHDFLAASQEIRSARNRRVGLLAGMSLIALIAIWFAVSESYKAVEERRRAQATIDQARIDVADANTQVAQAKVEATDVRRDAETARQVAVKAQAAAENESIHAEQQSRAARLATANLLAAQAQDSIDSYPQRGLLLAVEALNVTNRAGDPPTAAAEQALRDSLAKSGGTVLGGHEAPVTNVGISPDNRWLVSVSGTATDADTAAIVRLWDLASKDENAKPTVLEGARSPVAFSPDGHWLVTGSVDSAARLWNLRAVGRVSIPLDDGEACITTVSISPDNHWLISGTTSHAARLWDLTASNPAKSVRGLQGGGVTLAVSPDSHWLVTAASEPCTVYGQGDTTVNLWDLTAPDPASAHRLLPGNLLPVTSTVFSPDNRWLVTGSACYVTHNGKEDTVARVWNLQALDPAANPLVLDGHGGPVGSIAISGDSKFIATAAGGSGFGLSPQDRAVRLWNLTDKDAATHPIVLTDFEGPITSIAFGEKHRWLITVNDDESSRGHAKTRVWDLTAEDPAKTSTLLPGSRATVTPDGRSLLIVDGVTAYLWNLTSMPRVENPKLLRGHEGPINTIAFGLDFKLLATGSEDKTVRVWRKTTAEFSASPIVLESDGDEQFFLSPDTTRLVTRSRDKSAHIWDLTAPDPAATSVILSSKEQIYDVAISSDNHWLATGGYDKTATLFDLTATHPGSRPIELKGHTGAIPSVAFSPDNHWLVTASFDGTARLWNLTLAHPETKSTLLGEIENDLKQAIFEVDISPDSRWLVTSGQAPTGLWDLKTTQGPIARTIRGDRPILFSFDSRWLAASVDQKHSNGNLWNLATPDPVSTSRVLQGGAQAMAFSRDNRWLVTGGGDGSGHLWNLRSSEPTTKPMNLRGHDQAITSMDISPDNHWLLTTSYDATARLWDLNATDPASTAIVLRGHSNAIDSSAITTHWAATGSFSDNTARLWNLAAQDVGASAIVLRHGASVSRVAFTRDERWLITGVYRSGGPVDVLLWNLREGELIKLACRTAGRNLRQDEWEHYFGGQPYRATCPNYLSEPAPSSAAMDRGSKVGRPF